MMAQSVQTDPPQVNALTAPPPVRGLTPGAALTAPPQDAPGNPRLTDGGHAKVKPHHGCPHLVSGRLTSVWFTDATFPTFVGIPTLWLEFLY